MENLKQKLYSKADSDKDFEHFKGLIAKNNSVPGAKPFILDQFNEKVVELLYNFFIQKEANFLNIANQLQVKNASLSKGIMLVGNVGTGKTAIMRLFRQNPLKNYIIVNAKEIADKYEVGGVEMIQDYYQSDWTSTVERMPKSVCIDDLGTEDVRMYMGNRSNVIADIIEKRYAAGFMGYSFHATSNLTVDQMREFYGLRITSRLRETINLIELGGPDRRK